MSLRWSSYVPQSPPKGAQKRKTDVVHLKSHFARRKSATKFLCVKNVSGIVGLIIHAKIIGGGRLLLPEILGQTDRLIAKSPIFDLLSFLAPKP